jgi:hypothetical protein
MELPEKNVRAERKIQLDISFELTAAEAVLPEGPKPVPTEKAYQFGWVGFCEEALREIPSDDWEVCAFGDVNLRAVWQPASGGGPLMNSS